MENLNINLVNAFNGVLENLVEGETYIKLPPRGPRDLASLSEAEIKARELATAYLLGELRKSFQIGFLVFVPFLVIDLIVANILLALGMIMLSPTIVSLPFKIMIFVAIDGWDLIIKGLAQSFN